MRSQALVRALQISTWRIIPPFFWRIVVDFLYGGNEDHSRRMREKHGTGEPLPRVTLSISSGPLRFHFPMPALFLVFRAAHGAVFYRALLTSSNTHTHIQAHTAWIPCSVSSCDVLTSVSRACVYDQRQLPAVLRGFGQD